MVLFTWSPDELAGVSDAAAGQWTETGGGFIHFRRRLTATQAAGLTISDERGTSEAGRGTTRAGLHLTPAVWPIIDGQLGSNG